MPKSHNKKHQIDKTPPRNKNPRVLHQSPFWSDINLSPIDQRFCTSPKTPRLQNVIRQPRFNSPNVSPFIPPQSLNTPNNNNT